MCTGVHCAQCIQYTWIKSAGSAYELMIPWLYVCPWTMYPFTVYMSYWSPRPSCRISGQRWVVQDLSFNTHRFRILFCIIYFPWRPLLQSCLYVEMRDFLYLVWCNALWFGLVHYVPFDATLLEEEHEQREEWWVAGIAAGQVSENSREACTIEYVAVRTVTKCHFQRNFQIILLLLSTGYMEGPLLYPYRCGSAKSSPRRESNI